ncbi:MAG: UDP-N-acetylmuramoyl-tripeptide--D-alanyl-D-alanine ligase [Planctomycetota bacterium]|nr:UDP-N-acetylmuramoyl-tripeptide--D-alanyl-D-alanine ligase [Planctomycetota bacterium]
MIHFTVGDVMDAVEPRWSAGVDRTAYVPAICTDSRHLDKECLFVGLEGPNFDGARFAESAIRGGAICVLATDSPRARERLGELSAAYGVATVTCDDARAALAAIAREVRARLTRATVFGITGSCGKTSTKAILASLLAAEVPVVSSPASFNNEIGVPRTLFLADEHTGALVVELGTNGPGEIAQLAEIARPRIAIVTCVGHSHLEGLGSLGGVLREKGDLVAALEGVDDSLCVLNLDCPRTPHLMRRVPEGTRLVTVSAAGDERASLHTTRVERRADGTAFQLGGELATALPGEHFVSLLGTHAVGNALLSLAPLAALGAPVGRMASRLAGLRPEPHRLAPRSAGGVLLVDDSYNANPESVAAAIEVLEGLPATVRTLVLGPMAELGHESVELHRAVAGHAAAAGIDRLVLVGEAPFEDELAACAQAAKARGLVVHRAGGRDEAAALLLRRAGRPARGEAILVKASRTAALDQLVDALEAGLDGVSADRSPEVTA